MPAMMMTGTPCENFPNLASRIAAYVYLGGCSQRDGVNRSLHILTESGDQPDYVRIGDSLPAAEFAPPQALLHYLSRRNPRAGGGRAAVRHGGRSSGVEEPAFPCRQSDRPRALKRLCFGDPRAANGDGSARNPARYLGFCCGSGCLELSMCCRFWGFCCWPVSFTWLEFLMNRMTFQRSSSESTPSHPGIAVKRMPYFVT